MTASGDPDTETLLNRAAAGDSEASLALLDRHRPRLKRMLAVRTDERFTARFDDSDVVQEALADAAKQFPAYLASRPLPFYPWLRGIAERKLIEYCRHHNRQRRSVGREAEPGAALPLPDRSAVELARQIVCPRSSPSQSAGRRELRGKVREALESLSAQDREILVLHHLEQLTLAEAAAVLGIGEEAAKSRRRRALARLSELLSGLRDDFNF